MPITGIGSWRATTDAFEQHWTRANDALAPSELVLTGGYTRAQFVADAAALNAAIAAVGPMADDASLLSSQRETLKTAARARVTQYRLSVSGLLAGSAFASAAPSAPPSGAGNEAFLAPMNKVAQDWAKINALTSANAAQYNAVGFTPPLLLQGSFTLANFELLSAQLGALWPEVEAKTRDAMFARDTRNALMEPLRERMRQYRSVVPATFPKDSPLIASLPRLSPPVGNTPVGIGATGQWDNAVGKARFTWTAISDAKTDHVSIRVTPGPVYHAEDEVTIADLPKTETSFETLEGLGAPGAIANFKIYSVAAEGNENGGKAIEIIRPVT